MTGSNYMVISALFSIVAIAISIISLVQSKKSAHFSEQSLLKSIKSEVLARLYERLAKQRHLIAVYAHILEFMKENDGHEESEKNRIKNNIKVTIESVKETEKKVEKYISTPTTSIDSWNQIFSVVNGFLIDVTEELEKEKYYFEQLKEKRNLTLIRPTE